MTQHINVYHLDNKPDHNSSLHIYYVGATETLSSHQNESVASGRVSKPP